MLEKFALSIEIIILSLYNNTQSLRVRRIRLKKALFYMFLLLVVGICFIGVVQMNDATETKIEEPATNPAAELIQ